MAARCCNRSGNESMAVCIIAIFNTKHNSYIIVLEVRYFIYIRLRGPVSLCGSRRCLRRPPGDESGSTSEIILCQSYG